MSLCRDKIFPFLAGLVALAAVGAILLGGEWYLRRTGRFATYVEKNGLPGKLQRQVEPWLWTFQPNGRWTHVSSEFSQEFRTNSLGLTGVEPTVKKPGEKLLVVLGDSFVQGVGDPEGGGFVPFVSRRLGWRAINGGVAGSDPIFGLALLTKRLLKYKPDLVLLVVNGNDFDDIRRRGGLRGRLADKDGYLVGTPAPWWSRIFQASHLFRAFMMGGLGYNWSLRSESEEFKYKREGVEALAFTAIALNKLAAEKGFRAFVVAHPLRPEMELRRIDPDMKLVMGLMRSSSIDYIDLSKRLFEKVPAGAEGSFFWKLDAHFNPRGYALLGEGLVEELRERKVVP